MHKARRAMPSSSSPRVPPYTHHHHRARGHAGQQSTQLPARENHPRLHMKGITHSQLACRTPCQPAQLSHTGAPGSSPACQTGVGCLPCIRPPRPDTVCRMRTEEHTAQLLVLQVRTRITFSTYVGQAAPRSLQLQAPRHRQTWQQQLAVDATEPASSPAAPRRPTA